MLEFLADCFAVAAEEAIKEGKTLVRDSEGKTPSARYTKILAMGKARESFSMRDVIALFPNVPRRTLERDLAHLTKQKRLKATGQKKGRQYKVV